jgi:hypothetical protein
MLNASDRKVQRKIYGPVLVNEPWQNRSNHEIYREMGLTRNIRLRSLQWMGHVLQMKGKECPRKQ